MGRIERVADDYPLGVLASRLHHAWRYPRRARGDDGIDGRRFIHVREQLYFEIRSLGAVFLDEVGRCERMSQVFGEGQAVTGCALGQSNSFELFPGLVDIFAQVGLSIWG